MSVRNYDQKSKALIVCLILPVVAFMLFLGLFLPGFELIIPIGIPVVVLTAIAVIFIKFSWNPQHYCSRCNYPVSIYAEFCKNCGLKLIIRCPNCDNYIREGLSQCSSCGYALKPKVHEKKSEEYSIIEKDSKLPLRSSYCPTCGANLKNAQNIRFCEFCGSRIK